MTVSAYIEYLYSSGKKYASVSVKMAAIAHMHKMGRMPSPTADIGVKEMLKGVKRTMAGEGRVKPEVKPNVTLEAMQRMTAACGDSITGVRNRAMILTAFGGWLRKSELLKIKIESIIWNDNGFLVDIGKSKDNQTGDKKSLVEVPKVDGQYADLCPYTALRKWIETAKITTGPVWRQVYHGQILEKGLTNGDYFFELVAKTAKEAGISPSDISPHRAFRATPITLALLSGRPFVETMSKARHLSLSATSSYIDRSAIDQHEVGRSIYKSRS